MSEHVGPTPLHRGDRAPQLIQWLNLAQRTQLELDLDELPDLADVLERNYHELLARGSRNPDDPVHRYPIDPAALDLADRRTKPDATDDPIGEADLARRIGERRLGVLPTLVSWVGLAVGEMHDLGEQHRAPTNPDRMVWVVDSRAQVWRARQPEPSVASECLWLRQHLDWIAGQQWVIEFVDEIRALVADLVELVGDGVANNHACLTATELHDRRIASKATVYRYWKAGMLTDVGKDARGRRLFVLHEVRAVAGCNRTTVV